MKSAHQGSDRIGAKHASWSTSGSIISVPASAGPLLTNMPVSVCSPGVTVPCRQDKSREVTFRAMGSEFSGQSSSLTHP